MPCANRSRCTLAPRSSSSFVRERCRLSRTCYDVRRRTAVSSDHEDSRNVLKYRSSCAFVRFTPELSRWDPEMFVRTVLVDWLGVAEVWVGANFLFGHNRAGNFSMLRALGGRYGFRTGQIDPVRYKDFVVSSTRIRRLISEGRVDEAGALLGHSYYVDGSVIRGEQRGRTIGFPTANLCTDNELLPPHGVYATTTTLAGIVHPSVTNIGVRPTVDSSGRTSVETHIFDMDRDLYGTSIRVGFVQRLRDERAFASIDLLRAQIAADCSR